MGESECSPKVAVHILPHLTRCSRTHAHHPSSGVAPPIHPSCVSTDSCCVSLFMSGVVFVWVSLFLALRRSRCCSLSLPPRRFYDTHTRVI